MITTLNEFRAYSVINEMNTDVGQAVWQFYTPEGRKQFLGSESDTVNPDFSNLEWSELSDEVRKIVNDWVRDNPWSYTNLLTHRGEWQEYINRNT